MYDSVVIGQGLSGLLAAIWAAEQGKKVALVAKGTGKILQSSGVMELYPLKRENKISKGMMEEAVQKFKKLTNELGYPYSGNANKSIPIVTGAGYIKNTNLFPHTVKPIPNEGHIVIVGFHEIMDFQPNYVKGNLQTERPNLKIDTLTVRLEKGSLRTMTQLDGARLLDFPETRKTIIEQIQKKMSEGNIPTPDLFIFPASLGMKNWQAVLTEFKNALSSEVTEAPGMPPNTTAIRLHELLLKEAIKRGIRFYSDTVVIGCELKNQRVTSIIIKNNTRTTELQGTQFIIASGGVLGGGMEVTATGIKDHTLHLEVDAFGRYTQCPVNVYPIGASRGTKETEHGITGGLYSILSSYESFLAIQERGMKHA